MSQFEGKQSGSALVYDLTTRSSLSHIIQSSKLKRKYNEAAKNYFELIQDFRFPEVPTCMTLSKDSQYLIAAGTYTPRIKCFDFASLSCKFERIVENNIKKIVELEGGFRKLATLREDRFIEFHAPFGTYAKVRIPHAGRDMIYDASRSDILVGGVSSNIYRFSLERGIFLKPFQLLPFENEDGENQEDNINTIKINPIHELLICGTENGIIQCIDPREKKVCQTLDFISLLLEQNPYLESDLCTEVSQLQFSSNGVGMAVGTNFGQISIMDLRKRGIISTFDHNYESPINTITYHEPTKQIISADSHSVKIWSETNNEVLTSIEATGIHSFIHYPDSGLIFVESESAFLQPYYIPKLGPAPLWCSFLDNFTEELEKSRSVTVYKDYKFCTLEELKELGLYDLIGTDVLRPHMHGYFMKMSLYKYAKNKLNPVSKENDDTIHTDDQIENKIEKLLEERLNKSRIRKRKRQEKMETDSRFTSILQNSDFEIDPEELDQKKKRRKELRAGTVSV